MNSRPIQLWPSGKYLIVKGDTAGPKCLVKFDGEGVRFRKPTAEERREIQIEEYAERIADRDILHCDSALVSDALKESSSGTLNEFTGEWTFDNVTNLRPDPSNWDFEECKDWLEGEGHEWGEYVDLEDARAEVNDMASDAEVYEWWRVTSWLASQLTAIGQVVLDNNYGTWWGRCTTGQSMLMDGVLQRVAARNIK